MKGGVVGGRSEGSTALLCRLYLGQGVNNNSAGWFAFTGRDEQD